MRHPWHPNLSCQPAIRAARSLLISFTLAASASSALTQITPPPSISLGTLQTNVQSDYQTPSYSVEVTLTSNEVKWFSFTLTQPLSDISGLYLDIDTYPTSITHVDTTMGLYDTEGNRVAVNADAGVAFYAQLSFGDSTPARGPLTYDGGADSQEAIGINGPLQPGTYYLAVTRFMATMPDPGFDVTSTANGTDTFLLQFRGQSPIAVPEPATLGLAVLGLSLAICGYRRRIARA